MATSITSSNNTPAIRIANDQITTTSTDLAEYFGKRHSNVLRRIESLDCSAEFSKRNFTLSKYVDKQNKLRPQYHITRDGFAFLAMGFSGVGAAQFKEAYINAFNKMEAQLQLKKQQTLLKANNTVIVEADKYQLLNSIIKSVQLQSDPVIIPAKELIDLIHAVRTYQQQMAQLRTPEWVDENIERVKSYAERNFVDF